MLSEAKATKNTVDDMPPEDRVCFLDVDLRRIDDERGRVVSKPGLYIFGGRDYGLLVRVHTDGSLPHFRVPASPKALKAFDDLIAATNARRQSGQSGSP